MTPWQLFLLGNVLALLGLYLPTTHHQRRGDFDSMKPKDDDEGCQVVFEFVGGCRDGEIVESPLANPFFWCTDHAELGKRFTVASEYAVEQFLAGAPSETGVPYEYEIVERRVVGQTVYVKALSTLRRCDS